MQLTQYLPDIHFVEVELKKVALIRILSGIILFYVYLQTAYTGFFLAEFEGMTVPVLSLLFLIICFSVGFLSQYQQAF